MSGFYSQSCQNKAEETKILLAEEECVERENSSTNRKSPLKNLLIGLLVFSNLATIFAFILPWTELKKLQVPSDWARVDTLPTRWVRFKWHTPWGSDNDTEADLLWDNILTSHGHLAVDHEWASQHSWPPTMSIPDEPTKGLYLLESYHQLHCLKIVRRSLLETARGEWPAFPLNHARHCLDTLRQFIICHADNTPLYTFGDHTSGDGQIHKCRDWSALRGFATGKSACFRDMPVGSTLGEHFGYCDGGVDGLP